MRNIIDDLLFNIGSVNSSGLYNGKAGVALALFEAARFLQDEEIEDKAFVLFQETLIRKKIDYSFENGLSGIGYVLIHLITNKFIDADFDELFKEQCEMIIKDFENIDKHPVKLLPSLKVIYFLSVLRDVHCEDIRLNQIIEKIFQGIELYLSLQFFDWKDIYYSNNKALVLQTFETYLKLIDFSGYTDFSNYLISSYAELYRSGRIASSLAIGYYLDKVTKRNKITLYFDVINSNMNYGIKNIYPDLLPLDDKIDLTKIIEAHRENCGVDFQFTDIEFKEESVEKIKRMIRPNYPQYGYQFGLSRYLIHCVNKKATLI